MAVGLITGVTGQDGTYLAEDLLAEGIEVHGLVRPESTAPVNERVIQHRIDLTDTSGLQRLVGELQPEMVFHLAGQTSVAESWKDPVAAINQTGVPTAALLSAIADASSRSRFVNASSAEIFGNAPAPQNEKTPVRPISPYGAAKALGFFLVQSYRERGMHASSAILYNHESPLRSEKFVTRKISKAVAQIASGSKETLKLGNLDAARDWGWAPDYVRALRLMAQQETADDYVIGTGKSHSVREFVAEAFMAAGIEDWQHHVEIDPELLRPADPKVQLADSSLARARLDWEPTVDFAGIAKAMVQADLKAESRS
ncbi:MAG: GDP-mannose 4,6-dehydratase [Cryobacterium sp.]|nr:GDP-mannose 4,6-dehydratase [Cryobacterium sp.]MBX3089343.1 GDP-mannose 4,6-dehydratase [Cryobacterium sp.]